MTNVVPLKPRGMGREAALARETAALVGDLVGLMDQIRAVAERSANLTHPPAKIERTVQSLLDAVSALEHATETLTDEGAYTPF